MRSTWRLRAARSAQALDGTMSRFSALVLVSLPALTLAAEGRTRAPIPLDEIPAPYVTLGHHVVSLEQTTLKSIISAVGKGESRSNGLHPHDGGGNEVCYRVGAITVAFTSNGEFGGTDEVITDFRIDAAVKSVVTCAILPAAFQPVRVGGWLTVGQSRSSVERRLDTALGKNEATVPYGFSGKAPGACRNEDGDIEAWLNVTYGPNGISKITGGQTTTC
jgi:hypothetical protein